MKTNGKQMIRALICTMLSLMLLAGCVCGAAAEPAGNTVCRVSIDLRLKNNIVAARYDVTVYVDGVQIDTVAQGGRLIKILELSPGIHTFTIRAGKSGVPDMSFDIYVSDHMALTATLQTHRKYVNVNSMALASPEGMIEYDDTSESWGEYIMRVLEFTLKYAEA